MKTITAVLALLTLTWAVAASPLEEISEESLAARLAWKCDFNHTFEPLCRAIRAAVEGRDFHLGDAPASITAENGGTRIVFDFEQKTITGTAARDLLLAAEALLPNHIIALELRRFHLQGHLHLAQADFRTALTLNHVVLGTVDCSTDARIHLDGVRFAQQVDFRNIRGCGDIQIISSRFDRGLLLQYPSPKQDGTWPSTPPDKLQLRGNIVIARSHIDHDLYLYGLNIDAVDISFSHVAAINVRNLQINKRLVIFDSELLSAQFYRIELNQAVLQGNTVNDGIVFSEIFLFEDAQLYLSGNRINGRLLMGIRTKTGVLETTADNQVLLNHNRVRGSADLIFEQPAKTHLDLGGSRFDGELVLSEGCFASPQDRECQKLCKLGGIDPDQRGMLCALSPQPLASESNEASALTVVNLTGVDVGTFVWNLPSTAKWSGMGFRYRHWDPHPRTGQRPYGQDFNHQLADSLTDWLKRPASDADIVEAFTYGATYLQSLGYMTESAELRKTALQQNLASKTKQSLSRAFESLHIWHTPGMAFAGVGSGILYAFLFPTGGGANPEIAAFIMFAITLVCLLLYVLHRRVNRDRWPEYIGTKQVPACSAVPGFNQYNSAFPPRRFSLFVYSIDATLPVINLHHFDRYYPYHPNKEGQRQYVRWLSIFQHGIGWWMSTAFVTSLFVGG
jgi:hypothetical protein